MKVSPQDHLRVQSPPEPRARAEQRPLKRLHRPLPLEQGAPIVPAIDHMVTRARKFHPQFARQGEIASGRRLPANVHGPVAQMTR